MLYMLLSTTHLDNALLPLVVGPFQDCRILHIYTIEDGAGGGVCGLIECGGTHGSDTDDRACGVCSDIFN